MEHSTVSVLDGTPVKEIAQTLAANHLSAIPVVDASGRVIGIVSASDLLPLVMSRRWHHFTPHSAAADARTFMMAPVHVVSARAGVAEAARLASRTGAHLLPVVDDRGVLMGAVTRSDLVSALLRADSDIRRHAEREIAHCGAGQVRVQVDQGVVTLGGTVPDATQAARIVEAVSRIPGVIDLVNLIDERDPER